MVLMLSSASELTLKIVDNKNKTWIIHIYIYEQNKQNKVHI